MAFPFYYEGWHLQTKLEKPSFSLMLLHLNNMQKMQYKVSWHVQDMEITQYNN